MCVLSCNAVAVISYHLSESQTPAWAAGPALSEGSDDILLIAPCWPLLTLYNEHLTHRVEALASPKAKGPLRSSEPLVQGLYMEIGLVPRIAGWVAVRV